MSLQMRLVVLMIAAILPLSGLSVWFALRDMESDALLAQSQLQFTASAMAAAQDGRIESAQHMLAAIAALPQMRNPVQAECQRYLESVRSRYLIYANIGITDLQGRVLCLARGRLGDGDASDRQYFRRALAAGAFAMGDAVEGRATGGLSLGFAMPVADDVGKPVAMAFLALDLQQTSQALASIALPGGARVLIADKRGRVLMEHPQPTAALLAGRLLNNADLRVAAGQMHARVGESVDSTGSERLYAAAPTRLVLGEGLLAVVSVDRKLATRDSRQQFRQVLGVVAVMLLAGLAAAWWAGRRIIVKPARQILGAVRRLEQGRLDARVPLQGGKPKDEFGRIASAFNLMAQSLQMRQRDLEVELGHGRSAYAILETVLNSLQEGLIAANPLGQFLMFNKSATQFFPVESAAVPPENWPRYFGMYYLDESTLYEAHDMPMARAMRGESGHCLSYLRNALVPAGRVLQCSYRPLRGAGNITGGLVIFTDVTARRDAERALQASDSELKQLNAELEERIVQRTAELARQEARYRALAEQAPEVVWNVDPEGRTTYVNRAWYELVGGEPGDWLGHKWTRLIHPDDLPAVARNWEQVRKTLQPYTGLRRVMGKDGRWHTMSYRAVPVIDEQGAVVSWVGIDADITEQKAIESALRTSNQELEAFSYSVSHDLRAPLAAIGGFSHALEQQLADKSDERSAHYLARIQAGVKKMEQLIDALLSLAKVVRTPLEVGPVDLSALAHETLEALQMREPQRTVEMAVQPGLVAQGDARLVRTVLENLLGNAWKFSARAAHPRIEFGKLETGSTFFVRDNGVGFDMAYVGKLFGAFQRLHTEAEFPGTGIGLATVQRIVARHQGRIWAESVPGAGTTFFFTLAASGSDG